MKKLSGTVIALIALVIVFTLSAGGTIAAWSTQSDAVNKITIASIQGEISEDFVFGQTLMPGATVKNVVAVRNSGNIDARIRVKIEKAWGPGRDDEGKLIVDPSLSADNILITYNTTNWYYEKSEGYFYYLSVVKPGEVTPVPLMQEYTIDKNSGNEYKNMHADIIVHMECIQADGDGIKAWSSNPSVLGAVKPGPGKSAVAQVVFLNPEDGFDFNESEGDLFVNFKNLVPGESQSQVINIKNSYVQKTEIFLRADYIDQSQATPENTELIEKLLKQYASITITTDDGTVLYRGPVWGNLDVDSHGTDSAKYYISLGSFGKDASRDLTVYLSLDPEMDNTYQSLLGLIKWTFAAEGRETAYSDVLSATKTGEKTQFALSISMLLISGTLIGIIAIRREKKEANKHTN